MVLAAGASARMGKPKQLMPRGEQNLLGYTLQAAAGADAEAVLVVLGSASELIAGAIDPEKFQIVENPEWKEGMASSIRKGIQALQKRMPQADGVIIMVCDQPFITTSILNELIKKQRETGMPVVVCNYGQTYGPPVLFHKSFFPDLLLLKGDTGARSIIREHNDKFVTVPFPEGNIDIDTPDDYNHWIRVDKS